MPVLASRVLAAGTRSRPLLSQPPAAGNGAEGASEQGAGESYDDVSGVHRMVGVSLQGLHACRAQGWCPLLSLSPASGLGVD